MITLPNQLLTQAVCDRCGQFHNPRNGLFCEHCGRLYDAESECPTLVPLTQNLFIAFMRHYRGFDEAFLEIEEFLTLEESKILAAFLAWVKADQAQRCFAANTFTTRLQELQTWLQGEL